MLRPADLRSEKPDFERARGRLGLTVERRGDAHAIGDLLQEGCGRILFPARNLPDPLEAVLVNTAGGLTGGDRFAVTVKADAGTQSVVTTQACEKIYRADTVDAHVSTRIRAGSGARLLWIPQETILFEGSRLRRSLVADVAGDAVFLAAEAVILGRAAMGERLATAAFRDSWRIRRDGRLVFAEETACDGRWEQAFEARAALGSTCGAFATLVLSAPHAAGKLDGTRALLDKHGVDGGASVIDGLLVVRLVTGPGLALRETLLPLIEWLGDAGLPRVWNT